jgi:hypothetical protein
MTKPLEQQFKEFMKNIKRKEYIVTNEDILMLKKVNKFVDTILYTSPKDIGGYKPTGIIDLDIKNNNNNVD